MLIYVLINGCLKEQNVKYKTQLPCHSTEPQPRYQLVNCKRKQRAKAIQSWYYEEP